MIEVKETAVPGGFSGDLYPFPKVTCEAVRKQVLVVEVPVFMKDIEREKLRDDILAQMKTGVVILTAGYHAITCDRDMVITKEA